MNKIEIYPSLGCDLYALERVDEVDSLAQRLNKKGEQSGHDRMENTPGSLEDFLYIRVIEDRYNMYLKH